MRKDTKLLLKLINGEYDEASEVIKRKGTIRVNTVRIKKTQFNEIKEIEVSGELRIYGLKIPTSITITDIKLTMDIGMLSDVMTIPWKKDKFMAILKASEAKGEVLFMTADEFNQIKGDDIDIKDVTKMLSYISANVIRLDLNKYDVKEEVIKETYTNYGYGKWYDNNKWKEWEDVECKECEIKDGDLSSTWKIDYYDFAYDF